MSGLLQMGKTLFLWPSWNLPHRSTCLCTILSLSLAFDFPEPTSLHPFILHNHHYKIPTHSLTLFLSMFSFYVTLPWQISIGVQHFPLLSITDWCKTLSRSIDHDVQLNLPSKIVPIDLTLHPVYFHHLSLEKDFDSPLISWPCQPFICHLIKHTLNS